MKTIAITLGDVAGIGPEVVRKALRSGKLARGFHYEILRADRAPRVRPGRPSRTAARFALDSLEAGVDGCLCGRYAALVTGPVNKSTLRLAGFRFPGQTEWLAARTGARRFAMMLVGGGLRVVLVTTHLPLRQVAGSLSRGVIAAAIDLAHGWLLDFGIRKPRILVAGLNPHGGVKEEAGMEEKQIIGPAVSMARRKLGTGISGPYSPDHVFWLARQSSADAIVCMYHDQGLIPIKTLAFDRGVNVTLGLSIVRTSPDHGTAYDIAGKNRANPASMIEAINLAARMAARKRRL